MKYFLVLAITISTLAVQKIQAAPNCTAIFAKTATSQPAQYLQPIRTKTKLSYAVKKQLQYIGTIIRRNNFTVNRPLAVYWVEVGDDVMKRIANLKSGMTWLDAGAGEGQAISDRLTLESIRRWDGVTPGVYLTLPLDRSGKKAEYVALGVARPGELAEGLDSYIKANTVRYEKGFIEDYAELHPASVDVVTTVRGADIYGIYDNVLRAFGRVLRFGGVANTQTNFVQIIDRKGVSVQIEAYLARCRGFNFQKQLESTNGGYTLTRNADPLWIPRLQLISRYMSEDGPISTYRQLD